MSKCFTRASALFAALAISACTDHEQIINAYCLASIDFNLPDEITIVSKIGSTAVASCTSDCTEEAESSWRTYLNQQSFNERVHYSSAAGPFCDTCEVGDCETMLRFRDGIITSGPSRFVEWRPFNG